MPVGTGAIFVIIGLDDDAIRDACTEAAQGDVVEAVNFNAPGQVVIAGAKAAVERAGELCKAKGAKRALPLPVSAPSHCALMKPAAERLAQKLAALDIKTPRIPVFHNVDVSSHAEPDAIRAALKAQLYSPVRWVETVQRLARDGMVKHVEFDTGKKVLTGLGKRIDKSVETYPVYDPATLQAALAAAGA